MSKFRAILKTPNCTNLFNDFRAEKEEIEQIETITFHRFVAEREKLNGATSNQFSQLIAAVQNVVKTIASIFRRNSVSQMLGLGIEKTAGILDSRRMERYFNELFIHSVINSYSTCIIACKSSDNVIQVEPDKSGKFMFVFSSSDHEAMDSLNGTIFSIYRRAGQSGLLEESDILQSPSLIVAAGYVLYGSTTLLVFSKDNEVNCFALDTTIGEFVLIESNMKIPKGMKLYSANEGSMYSWDPNLVNYLERLKNTKSDEGWNVRYTGKSVADFHRTLKCGGLYLYPASKEYPGGKFKLLFQGGPFAFIMKNAGGMTSNGKNLLSDIKPEKIMEKCPFYTGDPDLVAELVRNLGSGSN